MFLKAISHTQGLLKERKKNKILWKSFSDHQQNVWQKISKQNSPTIIVDSPLWSNCIFPISNQVPYLDITVIS